jgi:hypothetical protein
MSVREDKEDAASTVNSGGLRLHYTWVVGVQTYECHVWMVEVKKSSVSTCGKDSTPDLALAPKKESSPYSDPNSQVLGTWGSLVTSPPESLISCMYAHVDQRKSIADNK